MKKTAIITGSSSGFGLLTMIQLAKQGFEVMATMRNTGKAAVFHTMIKEKEVLDRIHVFPLDVTDAGSIEAFREKVLSMERVDVLVNNAGFAIGGFAEDIEVEAYRRQFETNVFGVIAVTQALLPKMREQGKGTIINVSSISGRVAFPGLSPYSASKHALEGYTESLRLEVQPFGLQVALVEPGSYGTNIWSSGKEIAEKSLAANSPYHNYMKVLMKTMEKGEESYGDPGEVARLIGYLADKKRLKQLRYPIGKGVKAQLALKQLLPWPWWEEMVQRMLKQK